METKTCKTCGIEKDFYKAASEWIEERKRDFGEIKTLGWAKTVAGKIHPTLF
ncbi:MAG: hypothetical protein JETCAE03_35160 [Ignavibacteriaceae bacterium]|nr:MAG: hypothetical protein JETCAE03_35160 [Ignavibacteriaceae bacterium]